MKLLLFCLSLKLKSLEGTARFCEYLLPSDPPTTVVSMPVISVCGLSMWLLLRLQYSEFWHLLIVTANSDVSDENVVLYDCYLCNPPVPSGHVFINFMAASAWTLFLQIWRLFPKSWCQPPSKHGFKFQKKAIHWFPISPKWLKMHTTVYTPHTHQSKQFLRSDGHKCFCTVLFQWFSPAVSMR